MERTEKDYDASGAKVITLDYMINTDNITDFHDGLAYVTTYRNGSFFIDENGNKCLEGLEFPNTVSSLLSPRFENGRLIIRDKATGCLSIIDKTGKILKTLPPAVRDATNFIDGLAWVYITDYNKKLAAQTGMNHSDYNAIININGEFVCKDLYSNSGYIPLSGCIRVNSDGLTAFPYRDSSSSNVYWGYHDGKGNVVIKPQFTAALEFHDGMALVEIQAGTADNRKWGWIDKKGNWVIEPKYSQRPSEFDSVSGYACVEDKNDNTYVINRKGQTVLGPLNRSECEEGKFFTISPFCNGKAIAVVKFPGGYGAASGCCVVDASFKKLYYLSGYDELALSIEPVVVYDGKFYYGRKRYDLDNCSIVHEYNGGPEASNGLTRVILPDGVGYAYANGKVKIKFVENNF
ncbi:MAG: WG repeat-containing protein [Prevotella sp.]|nr:WG repeat-containing protein [Prevotella sp.]